MHEFDSEAAAMVEHQLRDRGIDDQAILDAMRRVPRHRFISVQDPKTAYDDRALPTAEGQTISQPYMVAIMTSWLQVEPGQKVLEIGTGSGYQTAILAHLGATVVSIEQRPALARKAQQVLEALGYADHVTIVVGDGTLGHEPAARYERILVTAGAPRVPAAYRQQLADGGRIVVPLGDRGQQRLVRLTRNGESWSRHEGVPCRFVPLEGADGWQA